MANIYLASRYSRREELAGYRADLIAIGHDVTSRWLDGDHEMGDEELSEDANAAERQRFAVEDWEDLHRADLLVAFTEPPPSPHGRGGRHIETGIALGRGLPVWIVGPIENVFHALPWAARFADWPTALARLGAIGSPPGFDAAARADDWRRIFGGAKADEPCR